MQDLTPVVVVDWDGTVTERDTLDMILREFGDPDAYARAERGLADGSMTYRQIMEMEMGTIREALPRVRAWLIRHARIRRGFRDLAARHDVLVLSSNFHELIEPLLAREGIDVAVAANTLDPRPDGWRIRWLDEASCATCHDLCKRRGLPAAFVAYVGDGYSDRCAALAADRVFARDGLARYLDDTGVAYEAFEDFRDVARALA